MKDKIIVKANKFTQRPNVAHSKFIAIVGPSSSGKSSIAERLVKELKKSNCETILLDHFYKDWSHLPIKRREQINFDSPLAFDFRLLRKVLIALKKGGKIEIPQYNYRLHKRIKKTEKKVSKPYVIVEGLLALHNKTLRSLFDVEVYVNVDKSIALSRRIKRDIKTRGETIDSVCKRYFEDVLPMQIKYVQKQKRSVDIVLNGADSLESNVGKVLELLGHREKRI